MNAAELTQALGGRWHGSYGQAKCPAHDDRNPSLSIKDGNGRVLVKCHAGCSQDAVIIALKAQQLWPDMDWYQRHISCNTPHLYRVGRKGDDATKTIAGILSDIQPIKGTAAQFYLRQRGLWIHDLWDVFFHPDLYESETQQTLPAMISLVRQLDGQVSGLHRTYLTNAGCKASIASPKKMLGRCVGGAVRLGEPEGTLALCEGIETGLSIAQSCPNLAVWATLSTSGLKAVQIPSCVSEVLIFADHDVSGAGQGAAEEKAEQLFHQGYHVCIITPPEPGDFNDLTQQKLQEVA